MIASVAGLRIASHSADETAAVAALLGGVVSAPLTVGLVGGLGAGKTHFVRGFVSGVEPALVRWVSSPTYAICHEIPHEPPILHYDLYRLEDVDDLEGVGFWEAATAIRIVEWPDRISGVEDVLDVVVALEITGGDSRLLRASSRSEAGARTVAAWRDAIAAQPPV